MKELSSEDICYTDWEPNEPKILRKDTAYINQNGKKYSGEVEIRVRFFPKPGIEIDSTFPDELSPYELSNNGNFVLYLGEESIEITGFINSIPGKQGGSSFTFVPTEGNLLSMGSNETRIKSLYFHIFNFVQFYGNKRRVKKKDDKSYCIEYIDLHWNEWQVEIQMLASTQATIENLNLQGGFGLTHIGIIRQKNGKSFSGQEAEKILNALNSFLSFARGYRCPPILPIGIAEDGKKVWEMLNRPSRGWFDPLSWFEPQHSKQLSQLFPGFMEKWETEEWQDTFSEIIYWYLNSNNSSRGIDAGIILTQTALERLAFDYTVKFRKLLSGNGFKALRASDKFRLLFSSLDIPTAPPENLSEYNKFAKQFNWIDAPHALTAVRNTIVHPDTKKTYDSLELNLEAWNMGLWYIEMALLRLCGYNENYRNRLIRNSWQGEVEEVPWIKAKN